MASRAYYTSVYAIFFDGTAEAFDRVPAEGLLPAVIRDGGK